MRSSALDVDGIADMASKLSLRLKSSLEALQIRLLNPDEGYSYTNEDGLRVTLLHSYDDYDIVAQYSDLQRKHQPLTNRAKSAVGSQDRLGRLRRLQELVAQHPYDVALRLTLSDHYTGLTYDDLSAGEAYKALLLVDEVTDESGEYHGLAFEAIHLGLSYQNDYVADDRDNDVRSDAGGDAEIRYNRSGPGSVLQHDVYAWASTAFSEAAYDRLVSSLLRCGCLRSATEMCIRMLKKHPAKLHEHTVQNVLHAFCDWCDKEGVPVNLEQAVEEAPDDGLVRRELYPWNEHEPDRFSDDALKLLNGWMAEVAPTLEVKATELPALAGANQQQSTVKQLGVFAVEDLHPGDVVLDELSLLTASSRLNDAFCDACSAKLVAGSSTTVACEECQEAVFCSQSCLNLAQESYHPALCDRDVSALARDGPAKEAADALYSLLLLRSLAMAETQEVHPLNLREVKYIWGDYASRADDGDGGHSRTLPFSFKYNILLPLNMLEKMDVNIFDNDGRYDLWVLNTLYAKFRGTASARQGPDGKPEIGAVHPLWCLANHSCDPDVTFDWQGSMKLRVKEQHEHWLGKPDGQRNTAGVEKGQEVMNHYCDITLYVKERREWAAGALGGLCMCERCQWEEEYS